MLTPYYADEWATIYHGDSFRVLHDLEGIGAVVTDPPYSSGGAFRGDRTDSVVKKYVQSGSRSELTSSEFSGDNRDQRAFLAWCTMWMGAARQASLPGAPMVSFIDWRQLPILTDAVQCGGWVWRNIGTWWKPGTRMQRGRFSGSAEYVIYATNGPAAEGVGSPQNVFSCPPVPGSEKEHVAEKPEKVVQWAMQVVPPGAVILDPFMGSGTTLRAARNLGFRSIGIEIDEAACEIAARRMQQGVLPIGAAGERPLEQGALLG
jgi:site-specific DNA-methyltransferase (adenine-specific)